MDWGKLQKWLIGIGVTLIATIVVSYINGYESRISANERKIDENTKAISSFAEAVYKRDDAMIGRVYEFKLSAQDDLAKLKSDSRVLKIRQEEIKKRQDIMLDMVKEIRDKIRKSM